MTLFLFYFFEQNVNALAAMQNQRQFNVPLIGLNQLLNGYKANQFKNWQVQQANQEGNGNDVNLDRVARFHRSSAGRLHACLENNIE